MFESQKVQIVGSNGEPISGNNKSVNVHQRFDTAVVNEFFHYHTGVESVLASPASAGDTQITVVSAVGFNVGDNIQISNGAYEETFPKILAIATNTLTINQPLDNDFSATVTNVEVINPNINTAAGTLASPVSYILKPPPSTFWYISRIILNITDQSPMDDAKFGGITALTNGVVFRYVNGLTGATSKFTVWQSNSDIFLDMYDLTYSTKAPSGFYGLSARGTFTRVGVEVPLNGNNGDYLEILVQDDLSGLDTFKINGQGHIDNGDL